MTIAHDKPATRSLSSAEIGVLLAIGAHLVWGGMAVYFGQIRYISPIEIAVNRGVWALPIAAAVVWSAFPYLSNDQVRQLVLAGAKDLGALV